MPLLGASGLFPMFSSFFLQLLTVCQKAISGMKARCRENYPMQNGIQSYALRIKRRPEGLTGILRGPGVGLLPGGFPGKVENVTPGRSG